MPERPAAGLPAQKLSAGLEALGLTLNEAQQAQLLAYLKLLQKWNKTYNLTAISAPLEMIEKHLLDSLAILPHLRGRRVLDIGSGAGLPGVPLAIAAPERSFVLLDANSKKTRFLLQVKGELRLANLSVVHSRLADYRPDGSAFDVLTARAFASLTDLLAGAAHLFAAHTRLLAMKGDIPQRELSDLPAGFRLEGITPLSVPGLDARRHLLCITPE